MQVKPTVKIPTTTVRIRGDLLEMARAVCYHTRKASGRRPKISQLLDDYLRPQLERDSAKVGENR